MIVTFPATILILKIWEMHFIGQGEPVCLGRALCLLLFQLGGSGIWKFWKSGREFGDRLGCEIGRVQLVHCCHKQG